MTSCTSRSLSWSPSRRSCAATHGHTASTSCSRDEPVARAPAARGHRSLSSSSTVARRVGVGAVRRAPGGALGLDHVGDEPARTTPGRRPTSRARWRWSPGRRASPGRGAGAASQAPNSARIVGLDPLAPACRSAELAAVAATTDSSYMLLHQRRDRARPCSRSRSRTPSGSRPRAREMSAMLIDSRLLSSRCWSRDSSSALRRWSPRGGRPAVGGGLIGRLACSSAYAGGDLLGAQVVLVDEVVELLGVPRPVEDVADVLLLVRVDHPLHLLDGGQRGSADGVRARAAGPAPPRTGTASAWPGRSP